MTSGAGKTVLAFGKLTAGLGRAQTAMKLGASGLDVIGSAFSKSTFQAAKFGTTMTGAGGRAVQAANGVGAATVALQGTGVAAGEAGAATAAAGVSLGTVAAVAGVATLAIAGGITVWELWGKKAVESSQRTDRWGSDVGTAADKALGKFKNTSTGIQAALTDMDTATKTSTKSMADSFDREFSQMESDARKHLEGVKKAEKDMSPEVAAAVDREAQHEKDTMNKILSNADQARTRANTILQTSNKNVASLSDTQRVMLQNNQQQIVDDELKMWSLTGNQRKKAMAALNNDVANMSHRQRNTALADLRTQSDNMRNEYAKQENSLKRQLKAGTINQNEYAAGMRANKKTLHDYVDKASAEYIRLARANGQSTSRIKEDMQAEGLSYSAGMKQLDKLAKNAEKNSKSIAVSLDGLKGKTKDAAKMWNDLVFRSQNW